MYNKPYLSVPEQVNLLESRGMHVANRQLAEDYLNKIGYYRLSAFWYTFRRTAVATDGTVVRQDVFKADTDFQTAIDLYVFDKKLRLLLADALERIEISLRTQIALQIGMVDPWAHRMSQHLDGKFTKINPHSGSSKHQDWLSILDSKASKSKEEFASHFRTRYSGTAVPIWVAVELLDFGPLSHLLSGMRYADVKDVSGKYLVSHPPSFQSWIRALTGVRNVCAHHSRAWNKPLVDQPILSAVSSVPDLAHLTAAGNTRLYCALAIIRYLIRTINPNSNWHNRIKSHFSTFPKHKSLAISSCGAPDGWQNLALWT